MGYVSLLEDIEKCLYQLNTEESRAHVPDEVAVRAQCKRVEREAEELKRCIGILIQRANAIRLKLVQPRNSTLDLQLSNDALRDENKRLRALNEKYKSDCALAEVELIKQNAKVNEVAKFLVDCRAEVDCLEAIRRNLCLETVASVSGSPQFVAEVKRCLEAEVAKRVARQKKAKVKKTSPAKNFNLNAQPQDVSKEDCSRFGSRLFRRKVLSLTPKS